MTVCPLLEQLVSRDVQAFTKTATVGPKPAADMVFAVFPVMFVVDVAVSVLVVFHGVTGHRIWWIDRRSAGGSNADLAKPHDLRR